MLYDHLTIEELLVALKYGPDKSLYYKLVSQDQREYLEQFTDYKTWVHDSSGRVCSANLYNGIEVDWPITDHIWRLSQKLYGTSELFDKPISEIKTYLKGQSSSYLRIMNAI